MNSRSACVDILVHDNKYFIAHALVGQWEYYELERRLLSRADERKPNAILIEDVGFGTASIGTLKHKGMPVIAVKPEGDKKNSPTAGNSQICKCSGIFVESRAWTYGSGD